MSEFGRVCERRTLRVNVVKSKVMRCSRYGKRERLEEVDCFKYLRSQVAADRGSKGKVFHGKEPPSGESTTTECGFNYQPLAVIY